MQSKPTTAACDRLHGVLTLCMEISNNTKADAFFSYSPHVNSYMVYVHRDGWVEGAEMEWVAMSEHINEENLMKTLEELRLIEAVLREKEEENV